MRERERESQDPEWREVCEAWPYLTEGQRHAMASAARGLQALAKREGMTERAAGFELHAGGASVATYSD